MCWVVFAMPCVVGLEVVSEISFVQRCLWVQECSVGADVMSEEETMAGHC